MRTVWMAVLVVALILACSPAAQAARRHHIPNPVGTILYHVMLPVADVIDYSRDAIGFCEADSDLAAEEIVSPDVVDLWRRQTTPDELSGLGVKITVEN